MTGRCGPYLAQTMKDLGYRTFGIGKFHTQPWDEKLGYDVHLHSEELYGTPDQRRRDDFAAWIAREHPAYDFIEGLMGERTEMYYMPQMSPHAGGDARVERWAADRADRADPRGRCAAVFRLCLVHRTAPAVCAADPVQPDVRPGPHAQSGRGDLAADHMDEQIPWMNYAIWAEDINDSHARVLKARYYGEISYIDDCIGRILDAVEARGDADNTLICFFADHGDHLGDHHAWQKESFFEASCHIPFLVSWPARLPRAERRERAGVPGRPVRHRHPRGRQGRTARRDRRAGDGRWQGSPARTCFIGYYGEPGTPLFKIMVRQGQWKYIYMANGGREQLFDLADDPNELKNLAESRTDVARARCTRKPSRRAGRPAAATRWTATTCAASRLRPGRCSASTSSTAPAESPASRTNRATC